MVTILYLQQLHQLVAVTAVVRTAVQILVVQAVAVTMVSLGPLVQPIKVLQEDQV
jgi:hypothetical protein